MINCLIYHFIHNINLRPYIYRVFHVRGKPYPCYFDEKKKKLHYCTCKLSCQYKDLNKLIKLYKN